MNKKALSITLILCMLSVLFLSGCKDNGAEKYVGEKITSMKEADTKEFLPLLEEGITKSNQLYALAFPEELKEPYLKFLQSVFSYVSFEVSAAEKRDSTHYSVKLSFSPIDIAASVKENDIAYIKELETPDLTAAITPLLKENADLMKTDHVYKEQTSLTIDVLKQGENFVLSEKSITVLVETALVNYMAPYNAVCDPLNTRDFLQAYLDAAFKGQMEQIALHLNRTPQELESIFNTTLSDIPADFTEDQKSRCLNAMRSILSQCQYSVGIPKKEDGAYSYASEITYRPNTSITEAFHALQAGTYASLWEGMEFFVQTLEGYAVTPILGEEAKQTITISLSSMISAAEQNSAMENLCLAICPIPQL